MEKNQENLRRMLVLYGVSDRSWCGQQTLTEQIEQALQGGITCLQLREKDLDTEAFIQEAREVAALCKVYGVPLIINDNVEVALACDADGVHVGQSDMEAGQVRARLGADKIIGVSVHNAKEALAAKEAGADYLGVGAVFATDTKKDAQAMSRDTLHAIASASDLPMVAIGGIHEHNVLELAGSGVDGIAVVSAIFAAKDIPQACRRLKALSVQMLEETSAA